MRKSDTIIIGAGPAGMMAAIRAAERKKKILLFERNDCLGRKLLISGKGRCNLTNSRDIGDFIGKFSPSGKFLRNAFAKFFNIELISFFETAGVRLKTEWGGRVFPESGAAGDILGALKLKLKKMNVEIRRGTRAREIIAKNKKIEGVLTYSGKYFPSTSAVIATGGLSYPGTGSTGDGYALAEKLKHKIIPLRPALSGVLTREKFTKEWAGVSLKNVRISLFSGGKKIGERFGEMLFTHFGLSGPVILDMSASVYDELKEKPGAAISINFKPALDYKKLNARILREFKASPRKSVKNVFKNLLPGRITEKFFIYCGVDGKKPACGVTLAERKKLINGLFDFRITASGVMPVKNGIITRGGVSTREINPMTMESRIVKGLFFAGEVIDVDAATGGYNMQAAFSTGWVCGDNV